MAVVALVFQTNFDVVSAGGRLSTGDMIGMNSLMWTTILRSRRRRMRDQELKAQQADEKRVQQVIDRQISLAQRKMGPAHVDVVAGFLKVMFERDRAEMHGLYSTSSGQPAIHPLQKENKQPE